MTDNANQNEAERAAKGVAPGGRFDDPLRQRDHKRRNQRIAAIAGGIAVFIAVASILTSVVAVTGGETSVVPVADVTGPAATGPVQTGPAETAPALASAASDVVRTGTCSDSATWRLELTQVEAKTRVRFEVHQSPVGHRWRIQLHHLRTGLPFQGTMFFRGTRVAMGDGGDLAVQQLVISDRLTQGLRAKAVDTQTGQVCTTGGWIG
jgi:hypothetical protein